MPLQCVAIGVPARGRGAALRAMWAGEVSMIGRRGFITGLISLVAAPAIVRAGSLMPVKVMVGLDFGRGPAMMVTAINSNLSYLLAQDFCTEVLNAYMPESQRVSVFKVGDLLEFTGPIERLMGMPIPP